MDAGGAPTAVTGGERAPAIIGGVPVVTGRATVTKGGAATATAAGAPAPARIGAGAAVGGAKGVVAADTAAAAPGAAIKVETGGVTVESTGDAATAGRGATPDAADLLSLSSICLWLLLKLNTF